MSDLADLEIALRTKRAYAELACSHTQCSRFEDSLGLVKGRDQILNRLMALGGQDVSIHLDLGEMIALTVSTEERSWPGHRWVEREDGRIIREVLIEDSGETRIAPAEHAPLGELRAGQGQFETADSSAILPPGFPDAARPLADWLQTAWNGRALNLFPADWLPQLLSIAPDGNFYFERALWEADRFAVLWRFFGHHASGHRIRLIGSSLFTRNSEGKFSCDETVMDRAALEAQFDRPLLDYSTETLT